MDETTEFESHARATALSVPTTMRASPSGTLTGEHAKLALDQMALPLRTPTKKVAGYRTRNGLQLAVERNVRTPLLWLERLPTGMRLDIVNPKYPGLPYAPSQSRHSNLIEHAPNLATGERAYKVAVPDRATLIDIVNAYAQLTRTRD